MTELRSIAGRGMNDLAVERDRALASLARVTALHAPVTVYEVDSVNGTWVYEGDERKEIARLCGACTDTDCLADLEDENWQDDARSVPYPCATIRAIAATEPHQSRA